MNSPFVIALDETTRTANQRWVWKQAPVPMRASNHRHEVAGQRSRHLLAIGNGGYYAAKKIEPVIGSRCSVGGRGGDWLTGRRLVVGEVTNRLLAAMNAHDLDAFVACFALDYRSEQPTHPGRAFEGRDKVRENWASVFSGVPDFNAQLLLSATTDDGVEIGEWHWQGTHTDGSPFAMRGVTLLGIDGEQVAWGRLYMDVIEQGGADIDHMVRETYRPPDSE